VQRLVASIAALSLLAAAPRTQAVDPRLESATRIYALVYGSDVAREEVQEFLSRLMLLLFRSMTGNGDWKTVWPQLPSTLYRIVRTRTDQIIDQYRREVTVRCAPTMARQVALADLRKVERFAASPVGRKLVDESLKQTLRMQYGGMVQSVLMSAADAKGPGAEPQQGPPLNILNPVALLELDQSEFDEVAAILNGPDGAKLSAVAVMIAQCDAAVELNTEAGDEAMMRQLLTEAMAIPAVRQRIESAQRTAPKPPPR
jgi:hypothetical protein